MLVRTPNILDHEEWGSFLFFASLGIPSLIHHLIECFPPPPLSAIQDSPVIQAVYTALKETESRATDVLPLWKLPFWSLFSERQRRALAAVGVIRETTESLIQRSRQKPNPPPPPPLLFLFWRSALFFENERPDPHLSQPISPTDARI